MDSLAQDPISIHQFAFTSVAMPGPFCYPSIDMTQCKVTQTHPVRPAPIPCCDATAQLQQPKLRLTHAGIDTGLFRRRQHSGHLMSAVGLGQTWPSRCSRGEDRTSGLARKGCVFMGSSFRGCRAQGW